MDLLLEATRQAEERHFWFRGFRRFVRPAIAEAARGANRPRILDCGCGTGYNLRLLQETGSAFGVDLTWRGLQFARGMGATRIARATVASLPFPDAYFDVVTSFDVLYCLDEASESAAAKEMWRVLKPGGGAVVNVAAMEKLKGDHSVLAEELRRYDRPRLRQLLEGAGFRIERLTYTNATLFPLMYAARALQRLRGARRLEEAHTDVRIPPAPANALLAGVLAGEARLVRHVSLPFGSSLLCVARKPR